MCCTWQPERAESGVDAALSVLLERKAAITAEAVEAQLDCMVQQTPVLLVAPPVVDLRCYDGLLAPSTKTSLTSTVVP